MILFDEKGFEKKVQSIFLDCFEIVFKDYLKKEIESPAKTDDNGLITKKEAAQLLSCSESTIDNFRRKEKLKRYRVGTSARFKKSEVLALAE